MTSSARLLHSGSSRTAISTMLLSIESTPSFISVLSPSSTLVIFICFFVNVLMTFFVPVCTVPGSASGLSSVSTAGVSTPAAAIPTGTSSLSPSILSALAISICIIPLPPILVVITGAAQDSCSVQSDSFSGRSASGEPEATSLTPLSTLLVIGVSASTSSRSVLPSTCSIRSPSGLSSRSPASTMSSNKSGSSRSAALITRPFCLLQQKIAGSLRCFSSVSFVIDIYTFLLLTQSFILLINL